MFSVLSVAVRTYDHLTLRVFWVRNSKTPQIRNMAAQSPLLRLSGELRNKIYREVLVDQKSVKVTTTGVPEPAFLLTCKQIRREGMDVFYGENRFRIPAPRYDSTTLMHWGEKVRKMREAGDIHVAKVNSYGSQ